MRDEYHGEIDDVRSDVVMLADVVRTAVARASDALLSADMHRAQAVISGDAAVDALHRDIEARALDLLARQAPVAGDLREIVADLRMVSELERVGDYAVHIAKVARRRYPASAVPPELRAIFAEMGGAAQRILEAVARAVDLRDPEIAAGLEVADDVMDRLHRQLFSVLLDRWDHGTEAAVDVTLTGRYYERLADHAVSVARQVVYLATGESRRVPSAG